MMLDQGVSWIPPTPGTSSVWGRKLTLVNLDSRECKRFEIRYKSTAKFSGRLMAVVKSIPAPFVCFSWRPLAQC